MRPHSHTVIADGFERARTRVFPASVALWLASAIPLDEDVLPNSVIISFTQGDAGTTLNSPRSSLNRLRATGLRHDDAFCKVIDGLNKMTDDFCKVKCAFNKVNDGFNYLIDGYSYLNDGSNNLNDGFNNLNDALNNLNDALNNLNDDSS